MPSIQIYKYVVGLRVAQALLPVPKADAFYAEHTGKSACATVKKPEQATDRTRRLKRCWPCLWGAPRDREVALAPRMGIRAQASRKREAYLLDGDR